MTTNHRPPTAGWYPDPYGSGGQSYWDGTKWAQHTPPPPPAGHRFTIHYGFALLAFFSFLGTAIPCLFMFMAAGSAAGDKGTDPQSAQAASDAAGIGGGMAIMWLLWGGMWTLIWAAFAINHTLKARRGQ
jgi:hypothetical protein